MNIETSRINEGIKASPAEFISNADKDYNYRLNMIADNIAANSAKKPVILISGPSGSGKTTTALMIEKILNDKGFPTHTLSMDNYFRSLTEEEKQLAVLGKVDLESPMRVDNELLNEQIKAISRCEEVEIPRYDFGTSSRTKGTLFRRRKGELVIFEGIHALNPAVITVPDEMICKIYVSVRTRITDGETVLHPSRVRLLRRMIRDKNFRKRSLRETMNMFANVEAGENKYIMPYKHRSDYDVDTFVPYELSAYRECLIGQLREMTDVPEINETLAILENLESISGELVPHDSLISEFLGHSNYSY